MKAERWQQVKEVLDHAVALAPGERPPYLDRVCATDTELRREVDSLLASHERAGTRFLQASAVDLLDYSPAGDPPASRAGRRVGVYQIAEEIGHGGMGEVYRATRADGQYEKEVAVKLVRSGYDTAFVVERFRHERQILASLDHPNIARLLDGGTTDDGIPYLVMELIAGAPIDRYCEAHKLYITQRLHIFRQVCAAVQYAHQRLVIHRDIKPSNILVTEQGTPKLLDFGIAKLLDPAADSETTLARPMTPEYASPEQVRGEPITTASDVYSLGIVLYRLLTSRSPYPENTRAPLEMARAVCEAEPERPSTAILRGEPSAKLRRQLSGDLDNIVLKALRKEPERRYATVERFSEDIRRHLHGMPVAAAPDKLSYRFSKFVRRHKAGGAATGLIVLAVLGGVMATLREARIAADNERRAERRFDDVRQLSNSLLFEVHDSIQDLPGSTPARKLIVQRSLEYLSRLAADSNGDISLQRELANAYERIGRVQGNPEGSNLGDIAGAFDSFGKALSIREKIIDPGSNDNLTDLIALAASYREMCGMNARYLGNVGSALDYCSKALSLAERISKTAPANRMVTAELAKAYEATGKVYGQGSTEGNAGDYYKALENHREALRLVEQLTAASPGDPDLSNWQGSLSLATADDLFETGRMAEALPLYQQSTRTFEALASQSNNMRYQDALDLAYQRMGDMLLVNGHFEESLTYYRKQLDVALKLAAVDPKNMAFRNNLAAGYATYGHALWRAGHVTEGLATLRRGLKEIADSGLKSSKATGLETTLKLWMAGALEKGGDIPGALDNYLQSRAAYIAICAADPKDVEDCLSLSGTEVRVARIYTRQGKPEEALAEYQKALAITEPLSIGTAPNLEALYTVVNIYYGIGDAYLALARRPGQLENSAQSWKQARSWYEKSRAAFLRIPGWLPITPNEFDSTSARQIEAQLSLCQSAIGRTASLQ